MWFASISLAPRPDPPAALGGALSTMDPTSPSQVGGVTGGQGGMTTCQES